MQRHRANINLAANSDESWTLDALGNWLTFNTAAGTGTSTAPTPTATTQTYNSQNEVVGNTYNHNGDLTQELTSEYAYDAWGDGMTTACACLSGKVEDYVYDALGRPIEETFCTWTCSCCTGRQDLYYSQEGQVTDDVSTTVTNTTGVSCCSGGSFSWCCTVTSTTDNRQDYSAGYVDELILRDDTVTTTTHFVPSVGGSCLTTTSTTSRLYVQQDANYNVTALTNTAGAVQERFVYDPYGNQQVLNATTWAVTTDAYNWIYGFQGGRTDAVTGALRFGARDYSPNDGRWIEPDPAGYVDGMNYYQADDSAPQTSVDPLGLKAEPAQGPSPTTQPDDAEGASPTMDVTLYGDFSYKINNAFHDIRASNAQQLKDALPNKNEYIAGVSPKLTAKDSSFNYSEQKIPNCNGNPKYKITLTGITVDFDFEFTIGLPNWVNESTAPQELQHAWDKFMLRVRIHEYVHAAMLSLAAILLSEQKVPAITFETDEQDSEKRKALVAQKVADYLGGSFISSYDSFSEFIDVTHDLFGESTPLEIP